MDKYNERVVEGKAGAGSYLLMLLAIFITLASVYVFLFIDAGIGILVLAVGIFMIVLVKDQFKVEFEYTITNGDIDIAKVVAKKTRKSLKTIKVEEITSAQPLSDPRVQNDLEVKKDLVVKYYTSTKEGENFYAIMTQEQGKNCAYILDLDEKCVENIQFGLKHKMVTTTVRLEG